MEGDLKRTVLGKIIFYTLAVTWILILVVAPWDLMMRPKTNLYGLVAMSVGFFILVYSKKDFLKKREYWFKFGFSYLDGKNRNLYFLSYVLLYLGFIISFMF